MYSGVAHIAISLMHPIRLQLLSNLLSRFFPVSVGACLLVTISVAHADGRSPRKPAPMLPPDCGPISEQTEVEVDLEGMTISDIRQQLSDGRLTETKLIGAYMRRIETYEANYNAFTAFNPAVMEEAMSAESRRLSGQPVGPLAGVPVVIKESMDYVGLPSTAGWRRLSAEAGGVNLYPVKHAPVVQRLVDAGAIILGKTNIPAFSDHDANANSSWAGPTYNTIDRRLAPGASSSGVATAVAGSFAVAGLGEETGGSIQNPAAAQSLVAIKPTFGLVPNVGVVPLGGSTRDVIGPIATSVADAAAILDVIAGPTSEDPKTNAAVGKLPVGGYAATLSSHALRGKRLGLFGRGWREPDQPGGQLSEDSDRLYRTALSEIAARGAILVEDPFAGSGFSALANRNNPFDYDYRGTESVGDDFEDYIRGLGVTSLDEFRQLVGASPFDVNEPLRWYVDESQLLRDSIDHPDVPVDLSQFAALKQEYLRIVHEVMDAYRLDALVFPQSHATVPTRESEAYFSATTVSEINIAGLPAVVVPAGQYPDGAPFSLIFIGEPWSEAELINLAYDYEQATQRRIRPGMLVAEASKLTKNGKDSGPRKCQGISEPQRELFRR